ncbi:coiled-coil domain-containing protein [Cricetulus griseus]|uniref:Coiled-coil domain-containing protein n=1 Tax=Cricetulus griseus TaxID=10029 RepID=A0A061IM63_CRIGR|nr:coiled-coil domain-containing protein [Cricetulus griseus]
MNSQRPEVRAALQLDVSAYLTAEGLKRVPVAPARTKVQCSQASLSGLSEPQTSWADRTHVYYQMAKRPLLRSFGPLATNPLQRGHSESSYSRSMMAEDLRSSFPLPPYITGIGKYFQPQTLTEFPKAEVGPTRKSFKNMKETLGPQEDLEDTRQPQEPKVLSQSEKCFLECLVKNHNQHKKNQERPRKGCVQECGEIDNRKHSALGHMKQTIDLQSQDKRNQTDLQQPLQEVARQRPSTENSLSEQEALPVVMVEEAQPKTVQKIPAWDLSSKESESKIYPSINRENQQLWRKLEQLAEDYYRVEETRRQLIKRKKEMKYQRWDSVIRGTTITLAEREHKQRSPKDPEVLKTQVSCPLHSTMRVNMN